jgi:hypothetical protein
MLSVPSVSCYSSVAATAFRLGATCLLLLFSGRNGSPPWCHVSPTTLQWPQRQSALVPRVSCCSSVAATAVRLGATCLLLLFFSGRNCSPPWCIESPASLFQWPQRQSALVPRVSCYSSVAATAVRLVATSQCHYSEIQSLIGKLHASEQVRRKWQTHKAGDVWPH